jgi:hypothetical protein
MRRGEFREELHYVMLVQTLLNAIQQTENGGVFVAWSVPPPSDPLVVDGFCGPITNNWILWFQQAQALHRDGIVDPVFPPVDDLTIGGDRSPAETFHVRVNGSNRASVAVEFPWSGPVDTTRP